MNQPTGGSDKKAVSGYFVPVVSTLSVEAHSLINLREVITRFRFLLLGGTIVGGTLMLVLSFLLSPKYRVEVLLAPVEHAAGAGAGLGSLAGQISGLGALAGLSLGENSSRYESIAVLRSKALTTEFMQEQNLLPVLFAGDWDAAGSTWKSLHADDIPSLEDAYREFDRKIRDVINDRETGLVTLTITWTDREQAAAWANQLVERANAVIRERAIDEYQLSIDYLNEELEKTTVVGIRQAIYSVIESQIEKVMLANIQDDYAFKVLDPAVAPDADDVAFPNRPLLVLIGLILGFAASAFIAIVLLRSRSETARNSAETR